MKVEFVNSKNEFFKLYERYPHKHIINIDDIEFNKKQESNAFSEKSYLIGNENIESKRKIKVILHLSKTREIDFLNEVNYIYNFFYKDNKPFYYVDLDNSRFCEVDLLNIKKLTREGTEFFYSSLELEFAMIDNLFFDLALNIITENFNNTQNAFVNINDVKTPIVYPIILIEANQSIQDFEIIANKTNIRILTNNFASGNKLIIDSKNSEVYIEKTNLKIDLINSIESGGFILLEKGNNTLKFNFNINSSGTIKIYYRERYIL